MPNNKPGKRERSDVESSSDDSLITISRSDLRTEIQDIVKVAISEAMDARISDFQGIRENMDLFSTEIDRLCSATTMLKKTLAEKEKEIADLRTAVDGLKRENHDLQHKLNDNENYQRRENIRISGIPEKSSESPVKVVSEFFRKNGFDVDDKELHVVHRVGKRDSVKPRPFIVRFFNRNIRNKIIRDRRKLKGSGQTISEDVSNLTMRTLIRVQKSE